ncbi:hypothetical protein EJ08DRAFT_704874 [Tothia fuscella]|uniref:Uncharacterized protein n=1 Tax=Tothia fuscella TaxID=1048955 RepID=A0A9P4NZ63_9PEZI|nr:hypothetical protein EJ08DRAFT_704874 [Tothia fuscella]
MHTSRYSILASIASLTSIVRGQDLPQCEAFGMDFQDKQTYFINSLSTDNFTSVTQFKGCQADGKPANVWFIPPSGNELECSTLPTTPDGVNQISSCPVKKNELTGPGYGTGEYIIVVFGNNGANGDPYGYERDFHLDIGPQVTATVTPTITFNVTSTPRETSTAISTIIISSTLSANSTITVPVATAPATSTVIPRPVTEMRSKTVTRTRTRKVFTADVIISTKTAECILPTRPAQHDPFIHYNPKRFHPKVLDNAKYRQRARKYHRRAEGLAKRTPDAPTITSTASPPVSTTATVVGPAITDVVSTSVTSTTFVQLPAVTVKNGTYTVVTTLATPTRTKYDVQYTTELTTKTITASWTITKTTTPYEVKTSCYKAGGHFGYGWRW